MLTSQTIVKVIDTHVDTKVTFSNNALRDPPRC